MHDPSGRVFRYDPTSTRLDCLLDNGPSPNGLVLDLEEKALLVAMTRGNAIWRLPLQGDGQTSKVGVFAAMAGGVSGADGLALDSAGSIYVCDAGHGCVWSFDRFGVPLYRYRTCTNGRTLTNLAFGGADGRELYITDSSTGTVLRTVTEQPGKPLFSHFEI